VACKNGPKEVEVRVIFGEVFGVGLVQRKKLHGWILYASTSVLLGIYLLIGGGFKYFSFSPLITCGNDPI